MVENHAILIGISFYPGKWLSLQGSVKDVEATQGWLIASLPGVRVKTLTASPLKDKNAHHPPEAPEIRPTYDNVISCLKLVTSEANPGDFVYIHYSGHGTAMGPSGEYSNPSAGDLALVLLEDSGATEIRYLRGLQLASLLEDMIVKGLTVTLVLDCCFSGSVMREDHSVRTLPYDPKIDAAFPPKSSTVLETPTLVNVTKDPDRTASLRPNWLLEPKGYTILSACGPHEKAMEIKFKDGGKRGALSCLLLRTFRKLGGPGLSGKQEYFYRHLCAQFREYQERGEVDQNPILYGHSDLSFLGHATFEMDIASIPIVKKPDGNFQLEAGRAHRISVHDQFSLGLRQSTARDLSVTESLAIAEAVSVRGLTSDLKLVSTTSSHFETGWMAQPRTRLLLQKYPMQLSLSPSDQQVFRKAVNARKSLKIYPSEDVDVEQPFFFLNALTERIGYQVRDTSDRTLTTLSARAQAPEETVDRMLDTIEHLARFQLARDLDNKELTYSANPVRQASSVYLFNPAGEKKSPSCKSIDCSHPTCLTELEEGEKLELVVENNNRRGGRALYVYAYNLGGCWEIENILEANHEVVPTRGSNRDDDDFSLGTSGQWCKKLRMTVPPEIKKDQDYCDDVIKIFLTVQLTSFLSLELPELGRQADRGARDRGKEEEERGDLQSEDWAAFNFRIRTRRVKQT